MTQVDFYLLDSTEAQGQRAICQLISQLYQAKQRVYVHCASLSEAQFYDELLWTFEEDSFIPHHLVDEGLIPPPPIQLGHTLQTPTITEVLFNLSNEIPAFYQQFKRILEVVPGDTEQRELSRQHYRFYQQQGFQVTTHQAAATSFT